MIDLTKSDMNQFQYSDWISYFKNNDTQRLKIDFSEEKMLPETSYFSLDANLSKRRGFRWNIFNAYGGTLYKNGRPHRLPTGNAVIHQGRKLALCVFKNIYELL